MVLDGLWVRPSSFSGHIFFFVREHKTLVRQLIWWLDNVVGGFV